MISINFTKEELEKFQGYLYVLESNAIDVDLEIIQKIYDALREVKDENTLNK